jgi:hypothetical protein
LKTKTPNSQTKREDERADSVCSVFIPLLIEKDSREGEREGRNVERREKSREGGKADRARREKVGDRVFV